MYTLHFRTYFILSQYNLLLNNIFSDIRRKKLLIYHSYWIMTFFFRRVKLKGDD